MIPMNSIRLVLPALLAAAVLPAGLRAQPAEVATTAAQGSQIRASALEVEVRAQVVELDKVRRLATLKGPQGRVVTLDVPAEVRNFDQVEVGDSVVVRYVAAVAARLEPASATGIRERVESSEIAVAAGGGLPGAGSRRTVEVLMTIDSIDAKARVATLRGPHRTMMVQVPQTIDLKGLKAGMQVRAVIAEAIVLGVERVQVAR